MSFRRPARLASTCRLPQARLILLEAASLIQVRWSWRTCTSRLEVQEYIH